MARILFVEDDALVRHGLARVLQAAGHDVRACASVAAALQAVEDFDAELALLDIGLPDGDGIACAQALQRAGFDGALVFLTAIGDAERVRAAIAAGASAYLVKPVSGAQLIPAIDAACAAFASAQAREARLQRALDDSREISAAVGLLAAREGCSIAQAFERLRGEARAARRPIRAMAAALIAAADARSGEE